MNQKLYLVLLLLFVSCSFQKDKKIDLAIKSADNNSTALEYVLMYYQEDPKKLSATHFLIENMLYNFTSKEYFMSTDNQHYYPDITRFPLAGTVQKHCDSLLAKGWSIRKEIHYDAKYLKADFLIRNIDLAFEAWQKPWNKEVSFDNFCRYILPYRIQNEPISNLRETLMRQYMPLLDSAKAENPLEACMIINARLKDEIKYKETGNPLQATINETYRSGIGTCEALCNYATFVMRAVGIPVAVHQTTWTRMDLSHNWCAVLYNGKFYDFEPGGVQPDTYRDTLTTTYFLQPAKVYRRHFDMDLSVLPQEDDGYVTQLKNPLFTDVTDEQEMPTYTLSIPTNRKAINKSNLVYLCAYNYYQWKPIAIGKRSGDICHFEHVAGKNFFIVAEAEDKHNLRYISVPILTEKDGTFHSFIPDTVHLVSQSFKRKTRTNPQHLYYWDIEKYGFKQLKYSNLIDSTQYYNNIPDNALLWHTIDRRALGQRVGIIVDGKFKRTYDF